MHAEFIRNRQQISTSPISRLAEVWVSLNNVAMQKHEIFIFVKNKVMCFSCVIDVLKWHCQSPALQFGDYIWNVWLSCAVSWCGWCGSAVQHLIHSRAGLCWLACSCPSCGLHTDSTRQLYFPPKFKWCSFQSTQHCSRYVQMTGGTGLPWHFTL